MKDSQSQQSHQTGMLSFARDLPNICSLAGLLCAVLGIYYAILGNFPAAIIGMIWAVFFD
jgi:CDP-diacylglycerol--serine O-phosphatidyltransferase